MSELERLERRLVLREMGFRIEPADPICMCTRQDLVDTMIYPQGWLVRDICNNCKRKVI